MLHAPPVMLFVAVVTAQAAGQVRSASSWCGATALVTHVYDGDTLYAGGVGRLRLLGIDAPELGGNLERAAPFAVEARERLESLVLRRWVRLECDSVLSDRYDRHLAYVFVAGRDLVNAQLVREGLARVSARTPLRYWDELRRAEDDAQARRRGIWGERPRLPSPSYRLPTRRAR